MKTLYNYLIEAKIDNEYEKNYSDIPRDLFDTIIAIDPKTTIVDGKPQGIGFVAKNLLLPAYKKGETTVDIDNEELKELISNYYAGLSKYPKPNAFSSVADFIKFMQNPESSDIEIKQEVKENPIDIIYNKYWSKIPREEFNQIIDLDFETTDTKIGDIARNLLLPKYSAGETWILKDNSTKELVAQAIEQFRTEITNYEKEKQNLSSYKTIKDFVDYKPISRIASEVPHLTEGKDYIYVASTPRYDVFRPLNFNASRDLAHTNNSKNVWCTAGGSTGSVYTDSYWQSYTRDNGEIYEFINKANPQNILDNYNLAIYSNGEIRELRNGDNQCPAGNYGNLFKGLLIANPDLAIKLKNSSETIGKNAILNDIEKILSVSREPLVINDNEELYKWISADSSASMFIKKIIINNVEEILPEMFANYLALSEVVVNGPRIIGREAFKGCKNLSKLTLNAPLEIIEGQAFAFTGLKGSIRLPDTLVRVEEKAFAETHCQLKVNKDRTTKLAFSAKDKAWVNSHVKSITI